MKTVVPERAHDTGTVFTVIGAKGGVGKTTLATNLAAAIGTHTDHSVLLVDLDTRFGDIAVLLDLLPKFSVVDLVGELSPELSPATLRQALVAHESGAQVLAAPRHPRDWDQVTSQALHNLVRLAADLFDYVILDTPGAFTDLVGAAMELADVLLLTTSLERTSVKDTLHLLDLMRSDEALTGVTYLIVNDTKPVAAISVDDLVETVQLPVYAEIPYDDQVLIANSLGRPVVLAKPRASSARAFLALAGLLLPDADGANLQAFGGRWSRLRFRRGRAA